MAHATALAKDQLSAAQSAAKAAKLAALATAVAAVGAILRLSLRRGNSRDHRPSCDLSARLGWSYGGVSQRPPRSYASDIIHPKKMSGEGQLLRVSPGQHPRQREGIHQENFRELL